MSDIQVGILAIEPGIQLLPPGPAVDALGSCRHFERQRSRTRTGAAMARRRGPVWGYRGRRVFAPPVYGTMSTLAVPSALNRNLYLRECP